MWLNDAMITNTCYNSTDPNVGLSLNSDFSTRKCYMMDTGLLITQTFLDGDYTDCLLYTSGRCRRLVECRSRWSPYH